MSRYHKGKSSVPLRDSGYVEFAAEDSGTRHLLRDAVHGLEKSEDLPVRLPYDNQQQLLKLLGKLQKQIKGEDAGRIQCRLCCAGANYGNAQQGAGHKRQADRQTRPIASAGLCPR